MEFPPLRAQLAVADSVARVDIFDYIDADRGFGVNDLVEKIDDVDAKEISIRIHSQGGDAFEGFAIFGILVRHPALVHVDVVGVAGSSASIITMAADKIAINPAGFIAIHLPWVSHASGNATAMRDRAGLLDDLLPAFVQAYKRHSSLSPEELVAAMSAATASAPL